MAVKEEAQEEKGGCSTVGGDTTRREGGGTGGRGEGRTGARGGRIRG